MFPAFYIMFFGLPVTWQLKGMRVECCGRWISRSRICVGVGNEAEAAVGGFRPSDSRVNAPITAKEIFQGTPLPQQANKSLLQQVLPRKGRMRNMVGLDNPATACWKTDFSGSYILLVGIVALHEIVQLQHEMVIQGAAAFCDAKHL